MKRWIERHKECIRRSVRTFGQAAVGFFVSAMASGEYEIIEWKTWLLTLSSSAVAAGVAAVMNLKKVKKGEL